MRNTVTRAGAYALRFSLLLFLAKVQAADLYVSTTGNDSNPGTATQPFRTITYAYSKASAGTTINVAAGVYYDFTSGWGIRLGKSGTSSSPIVLKGNSAIVDGKNASGRNVGFYIDGNYNTVDGFEIRNCPNGGITIWNNNNRILNNHIHHNGNPASSSTNGKDGVYSNDGTSGNYYAGNNIHDNGRTGSNLDHGLYLCGKNETVINNLTYRNATTGIQVAGYNTVANLKIYNNVVAWNGKNGIILWQSLSGVDIKNNIFYKNGSYGIGSYDARGSGVAVDKNVFYGNSSGNYNLAGFSYTLGSNLTSDPQLLNGASASFDAHLSSSSPAIKAGLNLSSLFTTDIAGAARASSGAWDIGAYVANGTPASNNTAPSITSVANQTTPIGTSTGALPFTVADSQTSAASLTVTASSSNPTLVPKAGIVLGGSGANRTVAVTPASGQTGTATITLTVSDGALSGNTSFAVTVTAGTSSGLTFAAGDGIIRAPFYLTNGALAQNVNSGVTDGGQAVYTFNLTAPGDYTISAMVSAPSIDNNSLFVNVDGQPADPTMIWDVPVAVGAVSQTVSWRGTGTPELSQYSPKVFSLTAGTHQLILRGRERNCQVRSITITPKSTTVTPPPTNTALTFASTNGVIAAPFYVNNGAVVQPSYTSLSGSGQATYSFTVGVAGNYTVSAMVNAPTTDNNSMFYNIDGQPTDPLMIWDVPVTSGFQSRTASWRGNGTANSSIPSGLTAQYSPKVFSLTAGTHQLIVRGREGNCQLGTITITPTTLSAN